MTGGRVLHAANAGLIQQLEAIVPARRQYPYVVETETAVLNADEERKRARAAQLFDHALVDSLHIDFQVVGHSEFAEEATKRDALNGDLFTVARVPCSPRCIEAAPVIVVEIDVKVRPAGLVPDGGVDNFQASFANCCLKSPLRSFTQRGIGIERDDTKAALQIEVRVVAIVEPKVEYEPAVFGVAHHAEASLSLGIA